MRRPSEQELRGDPWFGALFGVILDLAAAVGMSIDDLPDIIPEDPANSEELQRHMKAIMESRGLTDDWVRATLGDVVAGDAEAEPVVESRKDK